MAVPTGYNSVAAYLIAPEAEAIVALATEAFGATPVEEPMRMPDGRLAHVTLRIGDSTVMVSEPGEGMGAQTAMLHLYVEDCDAAHARALAAGASEEMPPADQPHGDRAGMVRDAGGNLWWIATQKEVLSTDEIVRRMTANDA
ncbi:MAG: VOC family protein [Pseudomonadota bacterium]